MSQGAGNTPSNPSDKDQLITNSKVTTEAKPKKPMVAKVKSEVNDIWTKCMEAEERSWLLRTLIKEGIGTQLIPRRMMIS